MALSLTLNHEEVAVFHLPDGREIRIKKHEKQHGGDRVTLHIEAPRDIEITRAKYDQEKKA